MEKTHGEAPYKMTAQGVPADNDQFVQLRMTLDNEMRTSEQVILTEYLSWARRL